ncbi:MAG TPA: PrgI family protein [Candidatus Nanoarchaeia archaeon]|nr:PrgI family protein [Candidatus Nanoarchaeia archaeon]
MRFQVPQFTDVEDKIIGPFTLKQFIYLAGSLGIIVVLFAILPRYVAIFFALPIALFGGLLAFYKINNQPFIKIVEAYVKYTITSKLYLWKHEEKNPKAQTQKPIDPSLVPKLSESKLHDLMWNLDVKQNSNPVSDQENR